MLFLFLLACLCVRGADETCTNPIIYAEPEVVRDGEGEPVASYRKPDVSGVFSVQSPQTSDEFNASELGLQWQWQANPVDSWFSFAEGGKLSLTAVPRAPDAKNLWDVPNLLLQKLPATAFTVSTLVDTSHLLTGERSGLLIMGQDYSYIGVVKTQKGARLVHVTCHDAPNGTAEKEAKAVNTKSRKVYLRISVVSMLGDVICNFSYSFDGKRFRWMDDIFVAKPGKWIGAKVGLFALGPTNASTRGHADYDWFRFALQQQPSQTPARVR